MHLFFLIEMDINVLHCDDYEPNSFFFPENQTNTGSKNNHWGQNATQIETIQRKLSKQGAEVILLGDSIIKNMERFAPKYFTFFPASTVLNAGIPGALSFCSEKPVVPVINQMERTFPLETFRKKKEYLLRYYSFLVFTGMIEKSCSICGVAIVSSSLVN